MAYLAGRRLEELPKPQRVGATPVDALRQRSQSLNVVIRRVELGRGNTAVTYESKDGTNVTMDQRFADFVAGMNDATVETAVATLPGAGTVKLDFPSKSAIGPTSSVFPVGQLVRSVLPLIADLTEQEVKQLARTLAAVDPADTLFPEEILD